jgi:hypothetical protein
VNEASSGYAEVGIIGRTLAWLRRWQAAPPDRAHPPGDGFARQHGRAITRAAGRFRRWRPHLRGSRDSASPPVPPPATGGTRLACRAGGRDDRAPDLERPRRAAPRPGLGRLKALRGRGPRPAPARIGHHDQLPRGTRRRSHQRRHLARIPRRPDVARRRPRLPGPDHRTRVPAGAGEAGPAAIPARTPCASPGRPRPRTARGARMLGMVPGHRAVRLASSPPGPASAPAGLQPGTARPHPPATIRAPRAAPGGGHKPETG